MTTLLEDFLRELEGSEVFRDLTSEEQTRLLAMYAKASEAQISAAFAELKKANTELEKLKQENARLAEEQQKVTKGLKESMRQITKEEIDQNRVLDNQESEMEAEAALMGLN